MKNHANRVIPKRELTYELLQSIGAASIGVEYVGGRKSQFGSAYDVAGVCFTRYFDVGEAEVAYQCHSGLDTVHIFGTPRIWSVPKPQLRPLSDTNWDC